MVSARPDDRYLLAEIRRLFPRCQDPLETLLHRIRTRERSGRRRAAPVPLHFGGIVDYSAFLLQPTVEERHYSGAELCEAIARWYNDDYWLLSLWNKLYENSANTSLGRDLVRAFVKHGIFMTAEELAKSGHTVDHTFVRKNGLRDRVSYYRELFQWGRVFSCMRLPERRLVARRLRHDSSAAIGFQIRRANSEQILQALPEINDILGFARLPHVARQAREQTTNLAGILSSVYVQWHFWRDSQKLRASLRDVLRSHQIITAPLS